MLNSDLTPRKSKWHYIRWARWIREEYHMALCSNHSEGFHSGLKKKNANSTGFLKRLSSLMKKIVRHVLNIPNNCGKSLKLKISERKSYILNGIKEFGMSFRDFCKNECNCKKGEFYSHLYKSHISCKHMFLSPCIKTIEELNLDDSIINDIIVKTLESDFNKEQLIRSLHINHQQCPNVQKLIDEIIDCFTPKIAAQIPFEPNLSFEHLDIAESETTINIPRSPYEYPKKNNFTFPINKKSQKTIRNQEMWLNDITDDVIKEATKLKYETIREIQEVYPKSVENQIVYLICDKKFREHFRLQPEQIINEAFITYKNDCWLEADNQMKSNKFFG